MNLRIKTVTKMRKGIKEPKRCCNSKSKKCKFSKILTSLIQKR